MAVPGLSLCSGLSSCVGLDWWENPKEAADVVPALCNLDGGENRPTDLPCDMGCAVNSVPSSLLQCIGGTLGENVSRDASVSAVAGRVAGDLGGVAMCRTCLLVPAAFDGREAAITIRWQVYR
jgi:hypothetical protein